MANIRYQNWAQEGDQAAVTQGLSSSNVLQGSAPLATITVYEAGTSNLATLFSDAAGSLPLSNPFTANADGSFGFYAAAGHYDIVLSGTVSPTFTISDVVLTEVSGGGGGSVSSVGLSAPSADFTVTGSPVTSSGTLALTWKTGRPANQFLATPDGTTGIPGLRAMVPADMPVFVASGASHAKGAVPDPGASAGVTKFLREDAAWVVPTGQQQTKEITVFRGTVQINANEEFIRIKIPKNPDGSSFQLQFSDEFGGGTAITLTGATGSTVFGIYQDTGSGLTLVGSCTWGIGATTGSLATVGTGTLVFTSNDIFVMRGPATPDTTLAGWSVVLPAVKVNL